MSETREISSIEFGLYSAKEILDISVCKIDNPKKSGYGTVYDERMGTTDSSKLCETCGQNAERCPGHFGHIELNEPIIHPLFYKRVLSFLNCFCMNCQRLIILKEQIYIDGLNKYRGEARFTKIQEKIKKVDMCCHEDCNCDQPQYKFLTAESSICKVFENKDKLKSSIPVPVEDIKKLFDNISNEDIELIGFDPKLVHPSCLILTILPVLPICDRPFVKADGNVCDDDLTNQYVEIIKANNNIVNLKKKDANEINKQKFIATLRFRILTSFNNGQGKAKHTTNGRPIKGIKERLAGKEGQFRNCIMGKRSCRFNTLIWKWDGTMERAENIKLGDIVIGDDGLPRKVIDTVSGVSQLYKIKQSKGEDYSVSDEHILTLKFCSHAEIYWQKTIPAWTMSYYDRNTKTVKGRKITVNSKITKDQAYNKLQEFIKTIDTNPIIDIHIKDYLKLSKSNKRLMLGIRLNKPIQWNHKNVPIDPRILGMWLGDGTKNTSVFTNQDPELIDYFKTWTENNGGSFNTYPDNLHHGIANCGFTELLKENNLYNNKHIPEIYIINSVQVRLELLAGLVDTDGSVEQDGSTIRITQSFEHKNILDDAKRIAVSLGLQATIKSKKASWTHNGEYKTTEAYILTIMGNISIIPTLTPRRKCSDSKKSPHLTKIEVVEDGIDRFCGFEVDGNHHFILGNDATITHNCNQSGRSVIGPDPTLKFGEIAVPREMANILTVPVNVTSFNLDVLQKMCDEGKIDSMLKNGGSTRINIKRFRKGTKLIENDIINRDGKEIVVVSGREPVIQGDIIIRNGVELDKILPQNRSYPLEIGCIVERKLQDGDYVLLNRQPTLHKASMLGMKVKVKDNRTIRMNLAVTKPFNKSLVENRRL